MDYKEMLAFAQAGFNVQQITALANLQQAQQQTQQVNTTQQNFNQQQLQFAQQYLQSQANQNVMNQFTPQQVQNVMQQEPQNTQSIPPVQQSNPDPLIAQIEKLTNTIQSQAIYNSNMPASQTADEILAMVIAPPDKAGNNTGGK